MLDEKLKEVIDMYPVEVNGVCRGRGAIICATKDGPKLLKEYPYSENHLIFESMLKYAIADRGYHHIDSFLYNKEGQLLTTSKDGRLYVMKKWYEGRECDLKNKGQVGECVKNLAYLHKKMGNIRFECEWMQHAAAVPSDELFARRTRELKSIRNYIRDKKAWNTFEILYAQYYDVFYAQAKKAQEILKEIEYKEMYRTAVEHGVFCHGDYSHHHVLFGKNEIAVVNFDKAVMNVQICDLYYFMRKTLEKYDWDVEIGRYMIDMYDSVRQLTVDERRYLYALLLYPEKFWKIANHYFNSRKSWTSSINLDKLKKFIVQKEVREKFLKIVFEI